MDAQAPRSETPVPSSETPGPSSGPAVVASAPPRPPRRIRGRVALVLVALLVVLVAAEGAARLVAPYLDEPLVYGDQATQVKVQQLDALGDGCVDVVVAGNSMGRDAFDPAAFRAADPQHRLAYNASLDAASPELLQHWLLDEVVPRVRPATVVIPVASLDLNAHGNATTSALAAYDDAPATRPGVVGRVEQRAVAVSDLVRYRAELRDPQALTDAFDRWRDGSPAPRTAASGISGVLGAGGEGLSRRPLHYRGDAGTKAFTRQQLLAGWELDPAQVAAASSLVTALRARGVTVVLAVLPVTEDYVSLHPRGREDFDRFLEAVRGVATATGAPLVDLHDAQPGTDAFADTHHLNAEGAAWFSRQLPTTLASAATLRDRRCPS